MSGIRRDLIMKALKGAEQIWRTKGELKKARETTLALLEMGMSAEQIAKAVNSFYRNYSELDI